MVPQGTKRKSNKIFYNLYWGLGDPLIEVRNERLEVREEARHALCAEWHSVESQKLSYYFLQGVLGISPSRWEVKGGSKGERNVRNGSFFPLGRGFR